MTSTGPENILLLRYFTERRKACARHTLPEERAGHGSL
jgi:hypothetical protein